jgi:uncharacterized protein YeaO (DUF488 family)
MLLYTIQIPVAKRLGLGKYSRYLDITVKSGDKAFAPTWKMVMGSKQGRNTDEEYTRQYTELMRQSYKSNRQRWDEVLNLDEVILACYCKADSFCHRYLLKDMLVKCGAEYVGEIRSLDDLSR